MAGFMPLHAGHPRLPSASTGRRRSAKDDSWMAGTSPAMTAEVADGQRGATLPYGTTMA
jgi:hypothetical protein